MKFYRYSIILIFITCSFLYANVDLWLNINTINGTTVDVDLYAKSTAGDLTQINMVQWAIAYKVSENTPSTTLQYDFASDWGPTITTQVVTVDSYNRLISWMGVAGSDKTITSSGGGTLLATVRFTKVGGSWGLVHIVSKAENSSWGCYIYNNSAEQTINYPAEDQSLPVAMSNITAEASKEKGVTINWRTESELNSAGFHMWRSLSEDKAYSKITSVIIPSEGNTSVAQEYSYCDRNVESNVMYWYKVEEISLNGKSNFFGPISVMGLKPVPSEYGLAQNYPNPFNPETMIEFQLPENADVSIVVYSLLGQEVKTLIKEKMEAGYQKVVWYGKDNHDVKVPSGMYIIQMQAGDFRQIRKMTIIR